MDREWKAGSAVAAPGRPALPSTGYPTDGSPQSGIPATTPGAYWYHAITEEIRAAIVAGGITPDGSDLAQLAAAMRGLGGRDVILYDTPTALRPTPSASLSASMGWVDLDVDLRGYRWIAIDVSTQIGSSIGIQTNASVSRLVGRYPGHGTGATTPGTRYIDYRYATDGDVHLDGQTLAGTRCRMRYHSRHSLYLTVRSIIGIL